MRAALVGLSAVVIACSTAGCGLLLDYDPPDTRDTGVASMDGGLHVDAARPDAGDAGPDAFARDAPPVDGGSLSPCFGLANGDDCTGGATGPARICIDGACVPSSCGDGFVDTRAGEECEPSLDPNCEPLTCTYDCLADVDCPTFTACEAAHCVAHLCEYVADHGGTTCSTPDGAGGTCVAGVCFPPGCGDGIVQTGEECDPGTSSFTGCHGCRFDCHADGDCTDGDPCNGIETCVALRDAGARIIGRECQVGVIVDCPLPMPCYSGGCTADATGAATCVTHLIDGDGDGFAMGDGCPAGVGGDCDDSDPSIHPGAPEVCNGIDDDCNGVIDDGTVSVTWCLDADGDGYGAMASAMTSCTRPAGPYVRDCTDCWDAGDPMHIGEAAVVHPGQSAFFTTPYCPGGASTCSFDYDCDGSEVEQTSTVVSCGALAPLLCATSAGWSGTVPPCGVAGTFDTCHSPLLGLLCRTSSSLQTQACH